MDEQQWMQALTNLVGKLCRRTPRRKPIPIVALVEDQVDGDRSSPVLDALAERLAEEPTVPFVRPPKLARPDARPKESDDHLPAVTRDDLTNVTQLLKAIAERLEKSAGGGYRLPRFRALTWLMELDLPDPASHPLKELRQRLRRRYWYPADETGSMTAGAPAGWLWYLVRFLPPLWWWLRSSGRVPVIGGWYRWLWRQSALPRREDDSLLQLAYRLTKEQLEHESPERVLRLLVTALLADLRDHYRQLNWRAYRTTNPVVLLDRITRSNGGYALVRAVNDARNETGLLDPLVLITTSRRFPPFARANPETEVNGDNDLLGSWRQSNRRDKEPLAWYLYLKVPEGVEDVRQGVAQLRLSKPRVPFWHSRVTRIAGVLLLLGAATIGYATVGTNRSAYHCLDEFSWPVVSSTEPWVTRAEDGSCIGLTEGSNRQLLPAGEAWELVRTTILAQNQRVEQVRALQPERPVITLVFLAALTPPAGAPEMSQLPAEREQLMGLAVAQLNQLNRAEHYEPLVRVLIANGGRGMLHGSAVVQRMGELRREGEPIVAATGLNESRESTARTVVQLAGIGVPTVAATLSADGMADRSQMYFQVAPQNRRQAEVVAAYADQVMAGAGSRLARGARIVYSGDRADTYSQNLAADLRESFEARGFAVSLHPFRPAGVEVPEPGLLDDADLAGRDSCGFGGVVLYAGRPLPDFHSFLGGIAANCRISPPAVVAGDDISRFVNDGSAMDQITEIPFHYVSFAVPPELSAGIPNHRVDFYRKLEHQFPVAKESRHISLNGHAALSYDAAMTAVTAAGYLARSSQSIPIEGGTVWRALTSITDRGGARRAYQGVTGDIDFGGDIHRQVPYNKPVAILRVEHGRPVAAGMAYCGNPDRSEVHGAWCPPDERAVR